MNSTELAHRLNATSSDERVKVKWVQGRNHYIGEMFEHRRHLHKHGWKPLTLEPPPLRLMGRASIFPIATVHQFIAWLPRSWLIISHCNSVFYFPHKNVPFFWFHFRSVTIVFCMLLLFKSGLEFGLI